MFCSLNKVPIVEVERITTCVPDFDWLWGGSYGSWGIPVGKISLLSGVSGCGKSRCTIELACLMSSYGFSVLYFQNEDTLTSFRSWVGNKVIDDRFKVSEADTLSDQLNEIMFSNADLVIIDSINQLREFSGTKKSINHVMREYRDLTKQCGSHIMFISQVNKDDSIKGGTELPHLVDTVLLADYYYEDKEVVDGHFIIRIGKKHRYGKTGKKMFTVWKHTSEGVICVSNNRYTDSDWCRYYGKKVKKEGFFSMK